jgi:amino-acid N-acetyltransferase
MNSQTDLAPATDSAPAAAADPDSQLLAQHAQFVDWMRSVAPYIHRFQGKTFVVAFGGEVVHQNLLNALVADIALLQAMGIQIVLVHGSRPQAEEQMSLHGVESEFSHGMRITRSSPRRKRPAKCVSTSRPRSARDCRIRRWRTHTSAWCRAIS